MANRDFVCADNWKDDGYRVKFNGKYPPLFYRANSKEGWIDIWNPNFTLTREYGKVEIYHNTEQVSETVHRE